MTAGEPSLSATIACPACGRRQVETVPVDACLYFYRCRGCDTLLRPRPGDCCVFCSYGSAPCPSRQRRPGSVSP